MLLAIVYGGVVGVALGLTGGGGSILAVPLLVFGLGVQPSDAVAISLIAVAATALAGATQSLRHGLVVWQPSLVFAAGGMLSAPVGAAMARQVPQNVLVIAFALLAMTIGSLMWRAARRKPLQATAVRAAAFGAGSGPVCVLSPDGQLRFTAPCAAVLAAIGLGAGLLSGLLGVGGGFLIVPALVLVTRMGVHRAVATSLLIITLIGLAGAATTVLQGSVEWRVLVPFAAGGVLAMIVTRTFAMRVAGPALQQSFAAIIVLTGLGMLAAIWF